MAVQKELSKPTEGSLLVQGMSTAGNSAPQLEWPAMDVVLVLLTRHVVVSLTWDETFLRPFVEHPDQVLDPLLDHKLLVEVIQDPHSGVELKVAVVKIEWWSVWWIVNPPCSWIPGLGEVPPASIPTK